MKGPECAIFCFYQPSLITDLLSICLFFFILVFALSSLSKNILLCFLGPKFLFSISPVRLLYSITSSFLFLSSPLLVPLPLIMHNQRKPQLHPLTPSYFHHHSPSISISSASGSSSLGPITPVDADEVFIGQLWEQVRSSKRPSSDNFIPAALQQALDEEERERAREREFEREKERERGGREQPREKEKEQQHTSSGTRSGMESMIKGYGYGLSAAVAASPAAAAKPVIAPNMSQTPSSSRRRKSM